MLLHLEATAARRESAFAFDIASLEAVAAAARRLGYRPLVDACAAKLGDFEARVRMHRWTEVVAHNEGGGCFVTMEGMVFDLEAWLPQHPGGATIIPQQALNKDAAVYFELYHASRESFVYLREFYIGELWPAERAHVPTGAEAASAEFLRQLNGFCSPWRLKPEEEVARTMYPTF